MNKYARYSVQPIIKQSQAPLAGLNPTTQITTTNQDVKSKDFGSTHVNDVGLLQKHLSDIKAVESKISSAPYKRTAFIKFEQYLKDLNNMNATGTSAGGALPPTFKELFSLISETPNEPGIPVNIILDILNNIRIPGITEYDKAKFKDLRDRFISKT